MKMPVWLWAVWGVVILIPVLLVRTMISFLKGGKRYALRVATSSRAVILKKVCVDPYCRDRGDHSSHVE
jgi:hypothetical protein